MLFKVYDKEYGFWWVKDYHEKQSIEEEGAYIFNTKDTIDMEHFHQGECFDKDKYMIKIVYKKGE